MVSRGWIHAQIQDRERRGEETYTWSSWFGQLNDEIGDIPNINISEGGGGRSFKQRLYDWKVHFTKELSMMSEKENNKVLTLKETEISKLHII